MQAEELIRKLADKADIRINGDRPWDIRVHNDALYARVLKQGTLGLGRHVLPRSARKAGTVPVA